MLLNHFFSYKIVINKLVNHHRVHRLITKMSTGLGKTKVKNLQIHGSNLTRNKPIAYLHYRNLIEPDLNHVIPGQILRQDSKKLSTADSKMKKDKGLSRSSRIPSSRKVIVPQNSLQKVHEDNAPEVSVHEIESIDANFDPIFTTDDIRQAKKPEH